MKLGDMEEQELAVWMHSRFNSEFASLHMLIAEQKEHMDLVAQNSAENQQLLAIFHNLKGFISILSTLGKVAAWLGKIGAGGALIWAMWKFGIIEVVGKHPPR